MTDAIKSKRIAAFLRHEFEAPEMRDLQRDVKDVIARNEWLREALAVVRKDLIRRAEPDGTVAIGCGAWAVLEQALGSDEVEAKVKQ
jgi:hypothetical protein